MAFKPATRKGSFVLVGLTGPSGKGKTYSALRLARGLVGPTGRIAFLDTETGRGLHYASLTAYDHDELWAPFSPERHIEKIREAAELKYDALILDSGSAEWQGTGGVLEMAEATNKQGLQKWLKPKTAHKKFINALLQTRMHIILCLRGKEKLIQGKGSNGKEEIVSQGIVPIQDAQLLFEMTISLMFDEDGIPGVPIIRKCPAELLPAFPKGQPISERTGAMIAEWVGGGAKVDHDAESLKMQARDVAEDGGKALAAWWKTLTPAQRAIVESLGAELRSAAKAADDMEALGADEAAKPADTSILDDSKPTDEPEIAKWGT